MDHPLGVEPGTGRDLFARLLYGSRVSLLISFVGTFITIILGSSWASSPASPAACSTPRSAG